MREGSTFRPGFWAYCNNLNKSVRLIKKGLLWSRGGGGDKIASCFCFVFVFVVEDFSSSSSCVKKMKLEMKRPYFFPAVYQLVCWYSQFYFAVYWSAITLKSTQHAGLLSTTGVLSFVNCIKMIVCAVKK